MNNLNDYLLKFFKRFQSPEEIEKFTKEMISSYYSLSPDDIGVTYKNKKIKIISHPLIYSEIMLHKKTLLKKFEESFPGSVQDIF